jgi:hypothetical protein
VIPLESIAPGETVWPIDWHAQLEPGSYEITWGAEGYGSTMRAFTVVEKDGRLYLGEEGMVVSDPQQSPTQQQDAAVVQAVSDLRARLGVEAGEITVVSVEATEFPDASLGVPEPGQSYAQVIVPGFVIRLQANGEVYEYHATGERAVLAPQEDEERSAEEPPVAYQRVTVPETGVTVEVPADWPQLEPALVWTPQEGSELRLGFDWTALEPPMELEAALLPDDAQIVDSEAVDLGWAKGRRFTLEVYGPAAEGDDAKAPVESVQTHVLVTVEQGEDRLGLDFHASAPNAERLQGLEPVLLHTLDTSALADVAQGAISEADEARTADWQLFEDMDQGFRFKVPQDWAYKEMGTQGPGVPDDWPVLRSMIFFPQAWAERFEQSGPPDPEAPPAIAVVGLEVCVGPTDQFRRVYPEPTSEQALEINGVTVVREAEASSEQAGLIRYVFQHPEDQDIRIVLSDALNGFSDRVEAYPELAALIPHIVGTFEFVQ